MTTDPHGWPDPARPGYPLHPERDGWHWLLTPDGEDAVYFWRVAGECERGRWPDKWLHSIDEWSPTDCTYLGPCILPADLAAERAAAAEAMREACAEACDGHAETLALNAVGGLAVVAARTSAAIIRSLPIPSASALAERDERMREDGRREAFVKAAEHLRRVALSYDRNGANQAAGGALRGEAEFIEMLAAETRARSNGEFDG